MNELKNATAKVIRRRRGEAIDIATEAGLLARICVIDIDGQRVKIVCVGQREVRFTPRTRQEAEHHARSPQRKRA